MSRKADVVLMATFLLLGFAQGQEDVSGFGEFINNVFLDNQFSNDFFGELMAAKYVFQQEPYEETFSGISKRSVDDDDDGDYFNHRGSGRRIQHGIYPKSYRNDTRYSWQPLKGYPNPKPVYVKTPLKSGNQTYKVVYNDKLPLRPLGIQSKKPFNKIDVQPVYKKQQASELDGNEAQRKNYNNLPQNITTYERKKLPKFLLPFPFGLYTKDPIRPFPTGSIFTLMPAFIIPFVPFGIWELRIPVAWSINYLIERFNGYDDGQLTAGRAGGGGGRSFANQQLDFYQWVEDLLSNTLGMDGKACVGRLICELAEAPVKERSWMGELLHRLVDPKRDGYDNGMTNEYTLAEDQGRYFGGCFAKYGSCPLTIRRLLPDNYVETMKKRRRR